MQKLFSQQSFFEIKSVVIYFYIMTIYLDIEVFFNYHYFKYYEIIFLKIDFWN